jgi:hypothetical protein
LKSKAPTLLLFPRKHNSAVDRLGGLKRHAHRAVVHIWQSWFNQVFILVALDRRQRLAPAVGWLLVRVEVDDGGGESEVVPRGERARVEVGALPGRLGAHARLLLEQHQHVPVDAHRRLRARVRHHLVACTQAVIPGPAG